jgi:hypothetical protein
VGKQIIHQFAVALFLAAVQLNTLMAEDGKVCHIVDGKTFYQFSQIKTISWERGKSNSLKTENHVTPIKLSLTLST